MIAVSQEFLAAQEADSAMPAYQINLVLSDYAASVQGSTATSSGDDASGNYPAAGAINSDHTEINIGAASAADNGIGKASWKSSAIPDGTGNVWLQINFVTSRTINRIKLYNLAANPITSYVLQYWDGSSWVTFAGSPDKYTNPSATGGYGSGGYGIGPYGGATNGGWPGLGYTGQLDVYDFGSITSSQIQLVIYATQNGGPAEVIEIEAYRVMDITSRTRGLQGPDRKKDLKMQQPIAAQEIVTVDNTDQFFSISYTPTASQVAAGYVNPELLKLGVMLEVNEGFYTTAGIELIRTFTGSVDSITPTASGAESEIVARDGMKWMLSSDSCKLKTNISIEGFLRYVLNRSGVSNYEMNLATTLINLPVAFYYETDALTTIQLIMQASGDAIFFFDEQNYATMQFYLTATPQQDETTTEADWEAGSLTDIDSTSSPNSIRHKWYVIDTFSDGEYTSNPYWYTTGTGWSVVANELTATSPTAAIKISPILAVVGGTGTWSFNMFRTSGSADFGITVPHGYSIFPTPTFYYFVRINATNIYLYRGDDAKSEQGVPRYTILAQASYTPVEGDRFSITKDVGGMFNVFINGISTLTATDTKYGADGVGCYANGSATFSNMYYTAAIDGVNAPTNIPSQWISPTVDRGVTLTANGIFNSIAGIPSGCSVVYYTASSSDGVNWDAYSVATPGQQDPCAVKRYERLKIFLNCPQDDGLHNANLATPIIYSVTVSWYTGTGQQKWSPNVNFFLKDDNAIKDLQQQVSDSLGGDMAIINDAQVTAAPLVLTGSDTDTQWQATAGLISAGTFFPGPPPSWVGTYTAAATAGNVSATTPLAVSVGTVSFICVVSGGMDISKMTGGPYGFGTGDTVSGNAIALTSGTAVGTVQVSYIHPTTPVLTLVISTAGTITDLRLTGKAYSNLQTPYLSLASDKLSQTLHHRQHQNMENDYVQNGTMTQIIANRIIANQKDPVAYLPKFDIFPPVVNVQPGDRINVTNAQTGIAQDFYVVGFSRDIIISGDKAQASMSAILMEIPIA